MFRPTERESINELWGVTLPDVKPYRNLPGEAIPEPVEDFLNTDFWFTDVHYGKTCNTPGKVMQNNKMV